MSMIGHVRRTTDQRVQELLAAPGSIEDFLQQPERDAWELDVDKAWHGIHYLLTGTAWDARPPLGFLVGGGVEVGDVDVGYGPARAFTSDEVRALWTALEPLDGDELTSRFDPDDMMRLEIYPTIWDRDPAEDDTRGYLLAHYATLRAFIAAAAADRHALLVWVG